MSYDLTQQQDRQLDEEGNIVDMDGNVLVPRPVVQQYRASLQWQRQAQQRSRGNSIANYSPIGSHSGSPIGGPGMAGAGAPQPHYVAAAASSSPALGGRESRTTVAALARAPANRQAEPSGDRRVPTSLSLAIASAGGRDAFASSAAPGAAQTRSQFPAGQIAGWQPQEYSATGPALGFDDGSSFHQIQADGGGAWLPPHPHSHQHQQQQQQQPQSAFTFGQSQPLPQRSHAQLPPTIRVTTDFSTLQGQNFLQPQDAIHSASSASSLPHDPSSYYTPYPPDHLSPQRSPYMPQDGGENMQTPVSPVSAHDHPMADVQLARKRSHSVMSQQDNHALAHAHSRSGSIASLTGASPGEDYSPRGSRAFKRPDPPTNAENKYICDFAAECQSLVFDRKCEWSKHMDKHDRPYRCPHPSCAKLQGFTYSGGLLRHEREVHGKHGGPKAQLMCPFLDCKRHSGKGFTRKENLNEHLRRVHSGKDSQSQNSMFKHDGAEVAPGADEAETPASEMREATELDEYTTGSPILSKRKRTLLESDGRAPFEGVDELAQENRRLRGELQEKDAQIRQLQEDGLAQRERVRELQDELNQYQQQRQ